KPKVGYDRNGNAIAVWGGDSLVAAYYSKAGNSWSAPAILSTNSVTPVRTPSLSVDPSGNAVVAWVQSDGVTNNVWVSRFNSASSGWSGAELVESSPPAANIASASINANGQAAVA